MEAQDIETGPYLEAQCMAEVGLDDRELPVEVLSNGHMNVISDVLGALH